MLRIGICDDLYDARAALAAAIDRILEPQGITCRMFEFSSGEGLLGWLSNHAGELDLIFLDMEMGELSGMETARRLRSADEGLQIVFVTGYTDYVFDGYSVGALGYLIKPPKREQIADVLSRAQAALHLGAAQTYLCRSGEVTYRLPKSKILYFCSDRRQVICVTRDKSYTFYAKLDDVEREAGEGFIRIHQRYLVRAAAVERVESGEVVMEGKALPISRSCQSAALAALTRCLLE
ncbi:LytTR family DNA-binding domain-containing protein [Oscillibacter sp. MSJ-2]|uniref:LytTR family DNA-binding domain-containing protein n=1 Tax=Dysosmobacter acutus TaxID=2841504 RepID=A0ABS6FBA9_9FIRM|nr:LytTR family DNA-binding domain-containing protein [Dysosmobacter acutus]MBU5627576.1 LytTR family DNA-binding domain-containing protein [Dysosmobacter acutus]